MKHLKLCIYIICIISTFFQTATLLAKTSNENYQVELIIFQYKNQSDLHKENWPLLELKKPSNAQQLNINNSESNNIFYNILSNHRLKYKYVYNRLSNNSRYRTIAHFGWKQPKSDFYKTKPIYFEVGKVYQSVIPNDNPELEDYNLNTPEISGVLNISLKRFFHAKLDLLFSTPAESTNNFNTPFKLISNLDNNSASNKDIFLQSFKISEKRRLKSKELGYFDHPAFGAIIAIS